MSDTPPEPTSPESDIIVCRVASWYFWRMAKAAGFLLVLGLYFFYDGAIGYPKQNKIGESKQWFETTYLKSFELAKASRTLEQWMAQNKAAGLPVGENGEPPKWATYAAQKGWPEEAPKHYGEEEIAQQYHWGSAMFVLIGVVGIVTLLNKGKTLVGYPDHMVMPNGAEVRFQDVSKVDKRKWDVQGLAYVFYQKEGKTMRATVDDLKFAGAGRVLARLLENFTGELIEKAPEEPEADSAEPPQPPAANPSP
jgi:hypothetical protein